MQNRDYEQIALDVARLVQQKQLAYGDSFGNAGQILRVLYPNGVRLEQFDELLTIARVLDKLFRIATAPDAFGESPWVDIMGYALLSEERRARL
jgi:hypothetical protein